MKAIDLYIGLPVCIVLGLFHKLFSIPSSKLKLDPPKFLIIKFFGMGSNLECTPITGAFK